MVRAGFIDFGAAIQDALRRLATPLLSATDGELRVANNRSGWPILRCTDWQQQ